MLPNCLGYVLVKMPRQQSDANLRVKCAEDVGYYEPLLARGLEIVVRAAWLFAYAIKCNSTPDSSVNTLASDLDNLVLVFAEVNHLHVSVCSRTWIRRWRVMLRSTGCAWRGRRELERVTRELEVGSQHHI